MRLYPISRIAEIAGVSRQAVNKMVKDKCPDAKEGTKVDITHPYMFAWLENKGVDPTSDSFKSAESRSDSRAEKPVSQSRSKIAMDKTKSRHGEVDSLQSGLRGSDGLPETREYGHMSLNEICELYGTDEDFRGWLDAKKKQVEIIEREIKVDERLGNLVSKDFVDKAVIGLIDGFTSRLLTDFCKSAPIDIRAAVESGKDNIQLESILRSLLSKQLNPVINQVSKSISDESKTV